MKTNSLGINRAAIAQAVMPVLSTATRLRTVSLAVTQPVGMVLRSPSL